MPLFPAHQQRMLAKQQQRDASITAGRETMPSKRELIEPHSGDKRYTRRDAKGEFSKEVDVGKSLAADRRKKAKTVAKAGQGDKGDRKTKR
jgi:hypothetical protein